MKPNLPCKRYKVRSVGHSLISEELCAYFCENIAYKNTSQFGLYFPAWLILTFFLFFYSQCWLALTVKLGQLLCAILVEFTVPCVHLMTLISVNHED